LSRALKVRVMISGQYLYEDSIETFTEGVKKGQETSTTNPVKRNPHMLGKDFFSSKKHRNILAWSWVGETFKVVRISFSKVLNGSRSPGFSKRIT